MYRCCLGAWSDEDWSRQTPADLLSYVQEEGMGFQADHPLERLRWRYVQSYPIQKLTEMKLVGGPGVGSPRRQTSRGWISWYEVERRAAAEDGRPSYYDGLERLWSADPVAVGPVIVVEHHRDGWYDVGDGWHRLGMSFRQRMAHVPAVVGSY